MLFCCLLFVTTIPTATHFIPVSVIKQEIQNVRKIDVIGRNLIFSIFLSQHNTRQITEGKIH